MPRLLLGNITLEVVILTKGFKRWLFIMTLVLATLVITGCDNNDESVALSRTNQIPESGIIEREIFASIMEEDDIAIFNSEDIHI